MAQFTPNFTFKGKLPDILDKPIGIAGNTPIARKEYENKTMRIGGDQNLLLHAVYNLYHNAWIKDQSEPGWWNKNLHENFPSAWQSNGMKEAFDMMKEMGILDAAAAMGYIDFPKDTAIVSKSNVPAPLFSDERPAFEAMNLTEVAAFLLAGAAAGYGIKYLMDKKK